MIGFLEAVVLVVLIGTIGGIVGDLVGKRQSKYKPPFEDDDAVSAAEAARLRAEVARLNDRLQVLERLATDPAKRLSDEIDLLKKS